MTNAELLEEIERLEPEIFGYTLGFDLPSVLMRHLPQLKLALRDAEAKALAPPARVEGGEAPSVTLESLARAICKAYWMGKGEAAATEESENAWDLWTNEAIAAARAFEPLLAEAHAAGMTGMAVFGAGGKQPEFSHDYASSIITNLTGDTPNGKR